MPTLPSQKTKTTRKKTKKSQTKVQPEQVKNRKVVYPELKGQMGWLTGDEAKTLLGWTQPKEGSKGKFEFLFKDRNGVPTKCHNVEKQRPFYAPLAKQWMGEILGGHWNGDGGETNGESMIIGRTGLVVDAKHRLVGLAWAVQEWLNHPEKYPFWEEEPKIHCSINFGVREDVKSINTINTGKPRTLGDAIYASGLFGHITGSKTSMQYQIKALSRIADYAVRLLWHRTGAHKDAFAPRRTHAESLDFIQRHPKLLECVKHIHEENGKDGKLKNYPSPGYAAALLYMMGSSTTLRENDEVSGYAQVDCPTEDLLDWSMWEKAREFWTELAGRATAFEQLRQVTANYLDSEESSYRAERLAVIIKAWWVYAEDMAITRSALDLDVVTKGGIKVLAETPTVGEMLGDVAGIDIGDPSQI